ncbi:AMP-binding protein, partial [Ruegeria sp. 2205SS24-7]|uniref:AMP-binding protein n=1 Tax=Ruegeria discodermiae TaxID=3064389 RepID=UPI0027405AC8
MALVGDRAFGDICKGRFAFASTIAFDAATFEIWVPLTSGGSVVVSLQKLLSSRALSEFFSHNEIDAAFLTTKLFEFLMAEQSPYLPELLIFGGEDLRSDVVDSKSFSENAARLVHAYGPTETTTFAILGDTSDLDLSDGKLPLGHAKDCCTCYVVDAGLNLVPDGVAGELLLGGEQVSRGYLGRSSLTAERFIADPFSNIPGARLYRTGDIVKRCEDGSLVFLWRADAQIKIRGMRVEPGEIEAALASLDGIAEAAVIPHQDPSGDTQLVAYIARQSECTFDEARLEQQVCGDWNAVYTVKHQSSEAIGPYGLDFTGWTESATGERYGLDAMLDWRAQTLKRLKQFKTDRVLEIGCGSGLILSGIAPLSKRYVGVDFNTAALSRARRLVEDNAEFSHVELLRAEAIDEAAIPDERFDLIILNSIIQYFPSESYLRKTLRLVERRLAPDGTAFFGDVRDLRLLECFHLDISETRHNRPPTTSQANKGRSGLLRERELVLDPGWFDRFDRDKYTATAMPRLDRYATEMARYRYDVALQARSPQGSTDLHVRWLEGDYSSGLETALSVGLDAAPHEVFGVADLFDKRLVAPLRLYHRLYGDLPNDVVDIERLGTAPFEPEILERIARDNNRVLLVRLGSSPGLVDAFFLPGATYFDFRDLPKRVLDFAGSEPLINDPIRTH